MPALAAVWILAFAAAAALPDYRSRLLVVINVGKAPDDTKVSALIDGETVAKTITMDGVAFIKIPGTGAPAWKEIEFLVRDVVAWKSGPKPLVGKRDSVREAAASKVMVQIRPNRGAAEMTIPAIRALSARGPERVSPVNPALAAARVRLATVADRYN